MAYTRKLKSGLHQGVYRDITGRKQYTKTFIRKRDAQLAADEQQRRVRLGEWVDEKAGKVTVRELSQKWLDRQTATEKTLTNWTDVMRLYVLPRWGDVAVGQITHGDVETWIARMTGSHGKPLAGSTRKKAWWVLSSILAYAVKDGRLRRNPALDANGKPPNIPRDDREPAEPIYLTYRQLYRLSDAVDRRYRALILLMGTTGPRPGEALALRVSDFDMARRRVRIARALRSINGKVTVGPTKTKAQREVAFSNSLVPLLNDALSGKARDDYVFPAPKGGPWEYSNFASRVIAPAVRVASTAVARLQAALGVVPVDGRFNKATDEALRRFQKDNGLAVDGMAANGVWEALRATQSDARAAQSLAASKMLTLQLGDEDFSRNLTPYDLRHSAASLAIDSGANVLAVSRMLGHASANMTLDVYGHLFPDRLDDIADRMDQGMALALGASHSPHGD